jgi:ADP-heptose:LPS heptosyltransferase
MARPVVIVSGSVREALFAQPLVRALEGGASVFAPRHSLDVFHLHTVGHGFAIRPGVGLVGAWRRLRTLPSTLVVVPPPVAASTVALAYLSGIQKRVGIAGRGDWWTTEAVPVAAGLHPVDAIARLAARIAPGVASPGGPQLQPAEVRRERLEARLRAAGIGAHDRVLVAIPGGGDWVHRGPRTRWPAERFAVLVNQLRPDLLVVVRGVGDERPARELLAGVPLRTAVVDLGAILPEDLATLAQRSLMVIGHDGDALHAAAAGGGRTLALLGPGDVAPYGPDGAVVRVAALEKMPAREAVEAAYRHLGLAAHA